MTELIRDALIEMIAAEHDYRKQFPMRCYPGSPWTRMLKASEAASEALTARKKEDPAPGLEYS